MTYSMKTKKQQVLNLAGWTWSWVATLALATFGPQFIWDDHQLLTILFVGLNFANGIAMVIANRHFFNSLDELQRKIQLEALGITLGLTVIIGITYSLLDTTNLIGADAEIGFLVGIIGIVYMVSTLIIRKRYA
ncbi:hypothetical protein P700755_000307 [Psychroflexus torquis ATCC 700755]|uniref:Uncharacterized protein n=1 Tax=Psychroflexus torquis (strain ATCC 700755 / CIP 106069 / ACAM 623) TaxID=313595 RepID=K4IP88_PSYTT|nr:hypothetical protein [Psychroflexus torquis]AFU67345.1 hypothetical protein P700755_000307 [Psychroflexus torquis ATCC 700755]